MAIPKKRHTRSRRGKRQSHHGLQGPQVSSCKVSGMPKLSHRVCEESGFYGKDKRVEDVQERL